MGRKLCPEQDTVLIPIALIVEVVGLVGIAEGVEAGSAHLFHAGCHLLMREGVALTKLVLILADTIHKGRFTIDIEAVIAILTEDGPREGTNTIGGRDLVRGALATVALDHRSKLVEVGILGRPEVGILHRGGLLDALRLARSQGHLLHQAEDLRTQRGGKLIHQLHLLGRRTIVLHLGCDVHRAVITLVPDVDTEGLDANLVRELQLHGAVDAERLRALTEAHLRRTSATNPRHIGNQFGVLGLDLEEVFALANRLRHIERQHRATHRMATQRLAVERNGSISTHTLKVQEGSLTGQRTHLETLLVVSRAVQVAVQELTIAVVVVPVVGYGDLNLLRRFIF